MNTEKDIRRLEEEKNPLAKNVPNDITEIITEASQLLREGLSIELRESLSTNQKRYYVWVLENDKDRYRPILVEFTPELTAKRLSEQANIQNDDLWWYWEPSSGYLSKLEGTKFEYKIIGVPEKDGGGFYGLIHLCWKDDCVGLPGKTPKEALAYLSDALDETLAKYQNSNIE